MQSRKFIVLFCRSLWEQRRGGRLMEGFGWSCNAEHHTALAQIGALIFSKGWVEGRRNSFTPLRGWSQTISLPFCFTTLQTCKSAGMIACRLVQMCNALEETDRMCAHLSCMEIQVMLMRRGKRGWLLWEKEVAILKKIYFLLCGECLPYNWLQFFYGFQCCMPLCALFMKSPYVTEKNQNNSVVAVVPLIFFPSYHITQ